MLEHLGVHAQNYTGTDQENQEPNFDHWVKPPKEKALYPERVRVTTSALNEIRVTFGSTAPIPAPMRWAVDTETGEVARERLLVYSDKLQPLATEGEKSCPRRRSVGLTSKAKHSIREGAAVMRDDFGKQVAFITLTQPGSSPRAMKGLARESKGILNAFMEQLRKTIARWNEKYPKPRSESPDVELTDEEAGIEAIAVWEPQKRGALHIHAIVGVDDRRLYKVIKKCHRRWWRQILEHYSDKTGIDLFEKEDGGTWRGVTWMPKTECEKVKFDVGAYLSKYISKLAHAHLYDPDFHPSKWWYISKPLFNKIRNKRRETEVLLQYKFDAKDYACKVAVIGADSAMKQYTMRNPGTGKECGYVLYFQNNETKDAIFAQMTHYLEVHDDQVWMDDDTDPADRYLRPKAKSHWESYEAKLDRESTNVEIGYADLSAPFSC